MSEYKVYMHTNKVNGKKYIGITCQKGCRRWRHDGYGYKGSCYFYSAIQKYGWANFETVILEAGLSKEEAEKREIELIKLHKTTNKAKGYNITSGGNIIGNHTEETRKIMSEKAKKRPVDYTKIRKMQEINKGRKLTQEQRKNMSEQRKGKKLSKEHVESIRKSHIGYVHPEEHKTKISVALKKFYEDKENREKKSLKMKEVYSDPVIRKKSSLSRMKINKPVLLTNTREVFENHVEAGKKYGIQNNKILVNCQRLSLSAGKGLDKKPLIWVFEEDYIDGFDYYSEYKEAISKIRASCK